MAQPLGAEWYAVLVETGPTSAPAASGTAIDDALQLAESLGATVVRLSGASVADEVLAWAGEHNISRIVVGRAARRRWRDRFRGSLAETLVARNPGIEISVITGTDEARPEGRPPVSRPPPRSAYGLALGVVAISTGLGFLIRDVLSTADIAMIYLLGVVVVGSRSRTRPAVLTAALSIALFDFIFVPPYYTFAVSDASYLLTFGMMLGVGFAAARLTGRIREDADRIRQRERETAAAYALSREISKAADIAGIERAARTHLEWAVGGEVRIYLRDGADGPGGLDGVASWVLENGKPAGPGTATLPKQPALYLPLMTAGRPLGVVRIDRPNVEELMDTAHRPLIDALVAQTSLGLERVLLGVTNESARVEVEAERLRTSLLSSLSHDLRTPLASIEGAASSLLEGGAERAPGIRNELAGTILEESRRMNRLVGNLLEMVRVQSGSLAVQKEWQPIEEVVGISLLRLDDRLGGLDVSVDLPPSLPLVPMDGLLIEQVLINLLENAIKYAKQGGRIEVGAKAREGAVEVSVADRGPGIPAGEEERIFDKFHRLGDGSGGGIGLGLAICRGIVLAHGGRIWAESRPGGGAVFRFTLPIEGTPPVLSAAEEG
jgi:two-component system sensor histidine kinase KdpD